MHEASEQSHENYDNRLVYAVARRSSFTAIHTHNTTLSLVIRFNHSIYTRRVCVCVCSKKISKTSSEFHMVKPFCFQTITLHIFPSRFVSCHQIHYFISFRFVLKAPNHYTRHKFELFKCVQQKGIHTYAYIRTYTRTYVSIQFIVVFLKYLFRVLLYHNMSFIFCIHRAR